MKNWRKLKRWSIALISVLVFVGYYLVTSPNTKFLANISWGVGLVLTLAIIAISLIGFFVIEILGDPYVDPIFKNEDELVDIAKQHPIGAGLTALSKTGRILAYAIIVAAAIIAFAKT